MFKPINGWTKQSILDYIKKEFKGKSENNEDHCLYRGPNGRKCVVGLFIPDEDYNQDFEGLQLNVVYKEVKTNLPLEFGPMASLQTVHDTSPEERCLTNILEWVELAVD